MPVTYKIRPDLNLARFHLAGRVDCDQVVAVAREFAVDPLRRPGGVELADLRDVTEFDVSYRTMFVMFQKIAALRAQHGAPRETLVLAETKSAFSMADMFASIVSVGGGAEVYIVRSEAEALLRLGRPEPSLKLLLSPPVTLCDHG